MLTFMMRNRLMMGVAMLTAALLSVSAIGPAQNVNAAILGRAELPTTVAMPLPNADRLPDLTSPAVVMQMLPPQSGDYLTVALRAITLGEQATPGIGAPQAHNVADSELPFLAFTKEDVFPSLHPWRGAPIVSREPSAFSLPTLAPTQTRRPFASELMLNVTAVAEAPPTVFVPIPAAPAALPVDFTSLLNEQGNIILDSRPDDERDVVLNGGRFALGELELGRSQSRMTLDETQFAVSDGVRLLSKGRIITHIRSAPAGLDFSEDAVLDIQRGAKIVLLWHSAPAVNGIHWGMRAEGDWRMEFRFLISSGRIIVGKLEYGAMAISKAVVIFDGVYTYITIDIPVYDRPVSSWSIDHRVDEIPEPASILLVSLGGLVALKHRRRRRSAA